MKILNLYNYFSIAIAFFLVVFMVFDGLRDAVVFSPYLSAFREIVVCMAIMVVFITYRTVKFKLNVHFLIFISLFFVFVYGFVFTAFPIYNELPTISEPLVVLYKHFQFFILFLFFCKARESTGLELEVFIKIFVVLCVVYVIITPLIYYIPLPFMKSDFKMWGRIGVGYPTMDAQTFIYAIFSCLYIFRPGVAILNVLVSVLIMGVLIQVTGTGILSIFLLLMLFFVLPRRQCKTINMIPMVSVVFIVCAYLVFNYSNELEKVIYLFNNKVDDLMNMGQGISTEIRANQFDELKAIAWGDVTTFLFGLGAGIYVENQYSFFMIAFGVVGFLVYLVFILFYITYGFFTKGKDNNILFLSVTVFALTSYTLVSFYLYSSYSTFALFMAYGFVCRNRATCLGKVEAA